MSCLPVVGGAANWRLSAPHRMVRKRPREQPARAPVCTDPRDYNELAYGPARSYLEPKTTPLRRILTILVNTLFALCASTSIRAGMLGAPPEDLEVSLVTFGPGAIYWERFGHNAIRIRDRVSGESGDINYGVFDFSDSAFLRNFARGHMRYMIDIGTSSINQQDYVDAGRSVLEQRLALSPEQAGALRTFLLWNLQPENVSYDYDYLTSNCSTRIRDVLNSILSGSLEPVLKGRRASMTYRQQIDRSMSAQPWLMLLMDLGLGPFADRPLNEWQESFLPEVLAREIRNVRVPDNHGGLISLVAGERELAPNQLPPLSPSPPALTWPLAGAGLLLAAAIALTRPRFPKLRAGAITVFLVFAGVMGLLLLALWTLTIHYAAWSNANLLIFNPLAFLMIPGIWRSRARNEGGRNLRILIAVQVCGALAGLLLHLMPNAQQNLPWLLFAIPVWFAIAAGLWRSADIRLPAPAPNLH